ncbi:GlxA family transcriptional regulator [Paraburkholderia sp. ZP32-5]|uniref:GlxA family transcriptional regulator n=1 Tax=Paraburkholderia sp. ZP32-5 TaxID=2883245 RepID=UPI001F286B7D|nr:GlxA family transcriptional regulator [Paraburkholderia sp. ZP32-5]
MTPAPANARPANSPSDISTPSARSSRRGARRRDASVAPFIDGTPETIGPARNIGILLIPGFAMMSYASVIEPLRASNALSGHELYRVQYVTLTGEPALSSSGATIEPTFRVGDPVEFDILLICAGGNPAAFHDKKLDNWLRRLALTPTILGGVSGGAYMLARAGLLNGFRCTIHWEHMPVFREEFPQIDVRRTLFEIDRNRWTCAGGIAPLDLLFAMIEKDHGHALAVAVGDWLLQTEVRLGGRPQRMSMQQRYQIKHPKLLHALELIEHHIEDPIGRDEIASIVELSVRQLERLFRSHLGLSFRDHYIAVRLEQAQRLLRQSALSIAEIAVATGFINSSHFARVYRTSFGHSPTDERQFLSCKHAANAPAALLMS